MPEIYVKMAEGRSMEQKRGLVKDITEAIVKHLNVAPDRVMVQIDETPRHNKAKGGVLFSDMPGGKPA